MKTNSSSIFSISKLREKILGFRKDSKGVAALEFAIIAPILILLFLGTLEISLAVSVDRKVSRISSAVADLITQETETIDADYLDSVFAIADRIMYPHDDSVEIAVVGIDIDENSVARVTWKRTYGGATAPAVGSTYPVPNSIKNPDTFLVAATVKTDHAPAFKFVNYNNGNLTFDGATIELSEEMFLRPRQSDSQMCTDC